MVVERARYPYALQKKIIRGVPSEVVRETAGWTRPGLTLGTTTPASTKLLWRRNYIVMFYSNNIRVQSLDVILNNLAGLRG